MIVGAKLEVTTCLEAFLKAALRYVSLYTQGSQAAQSRSQPVLRFSVPDKPGITELEGRRGPVEFSERGHETHARLLRALDSLHLGLGVAAQVKRNRGMIDGGERVSQLTINLALF